jgi:hypothetical protein
MSVSSIALSGSNAGDFAQTISCGGSLAAGADCTINVTFTPSASGSRAASLSIADNASGSPQTVTLSGTGTAAIAGVSPTSLAFGNQSVGVTSTTQTITLTNSGNGALGVTSIAVSGTNASDFSQSNSCGSSVAAGSNCTISVIFKPAATGTRTATVTVTDNATGSPQAVTLSGTGTAATASASPTSLAFGNQSVGVTSTALAITLTNSGNAALSITGITFSGANSNDFSQSNNCGASVAADANCTISVTFTPSASGIRSASLSIADNASGSPQTVALSGAGTSASGTVSLSPNNIAFSSEPVDMTSAGETVTLTNNGSTILSITSIAVTGANASDFAQNNTCGSSVAAGANCTIVVLFTPSASGARSAAISITDNATGSPQAVSLSGTGSHDVVLTWTASTSSGVIGYNIYRGTKSGGESSTPLNSTPVSTTTFTDENVTAGTEYFYIVTSVTSDGGTQSAASPETDATVPSP